MRDGRARLLDHHIKVFSADGLQGTIHINRLQRDCVRDISHASAADGDCAKSCACLRPYTQDNNQLAVDT